MIADTAVTTKPSTSKLINSSLCLKLTPCGLGITFFDTGFVERARGFRSGFAKGLTCAGLRGVGVGVTGLFIGNKVEIYKFLKHYAAFRNGHEITCTSYSLSLRERVGERGFKLLKLFRARS